MSSDDYVTHADLGGQLGHGPIKLESKYQAWHADWEPRVFALQLSLGAAGVWNLDMTRSARETLPDYEERSYYAIWFAALLKQLEERGLVSADEVAAGRAIHPDRKRCANHKCRRYSHPRRAPSSGRAPRRCQ